MLHPPSPSSLPHLLPLSLRALSTAPTSFLPSAKLDQWKVKRSTPTLTRLREGAIQGLTGALNKVHPKSLVNDHITFKDGSLLASGWRHKEDGHEPEEETVKIALNGEISRAIVIGGGKATLEMAKAISHALDGVIPFEGVINVPYGQGDDLHEGTLTTPSGDLIKVNHCRHPLPDQSGVVGVDMMLDLIKASPPDTLVISLISGGGSALLPSPCPSISLEDKMQVTQLLLDSGASIQEVNTVRKHLSSVKGGKLTQATFPRRHLALVLSDVVGDDLSSIASGPTIPDPTTFADAWGVCTEYGLIDRMPERTLQVLSKGKAAEEEKKPGEESQSAATFAKSDTLIIGSAKLASSYFTQYSNIQPACVKTNQLSGEASDFGKELALTDWKQLLSQQAGSSETKEACWVSTGEFTVTIKGKGKGGRNQEMLLSFLCHALKKEIEGDKANHLQFNHGNAEERGKQADNDKLEFVFLSAAFDGIEGNSPAMGAIVDSDTLGELEEKTCSASKEELLSVLLRHLNNNDSHTLLDSVGASLKIGHSGTNVNDMTVLIVSSKQNEGT